MQIPRTQATQTSYNDFKQNQSPSISHEQFDFANETIVQEYRYWYIIKNRFPYDTMVRVNDMLVSKRAVSTFKELKADEITEYSQILEELTESKSYDARIENFPHVKSVTQHIHIHLVCWHNTVS